MKFYLYAGVKLPTLIWWGLRPVSLSDDMCVVSVRYGWRTQNPFKSIYFSTLLGGAELSTGLLLIRLLGKSGSYSSLVVDAEASFVKKAVGRIYFTCVDGSVVQSAIASCDATGEAQRFVLESVGKNSEGEKVCTVRITWSIIKRTKK